jgi:hypothetical protein
MKINNEKFLKIGIGDNDYSNSLRIVCENLNEIIARSYSRTDFSNLSGNQWDIFCSYIKTFFFNVVALGWALEDRHNGLFQFANECNNRFKIEICNYDEIPSFDNCDYYYIQITGKDKGYYLTV